MAGPNTLLDFLRRHTAVDCDTSNVQVAKKLGPFEDCTSNQAIAYAELQEPRHKPLLQRSIALSRSFIKDFPEVTVEQLSVDVAMISLALQIKPFINGSVHVQTNPFSAYSIVKQVKHAERIIRLFRYLDTEFDISRICIKIPSTWEGLQACRELEASGIRTLATTVFSIEQVSIAGEVGCRYIAPYVNELKVHFDKEYRDHHPQMKLCVAAQRYYEQYSLPTLVLAASFTSAQETITLAGIRHMTIAESLLEQLSSTTLDSIKTPLSTLFDDPKTLIEIPHARMQLANDEPAFRLAFSQNNNGEAAAKLAQALDIFCDMQIKLEKMMSSLGNDDREND